MAIITQAQAITRCQGIRDATADNANTAALVGQLLADIAESLTTWGSGSGPTGPAGPTGPTGATGPAGPVAGTNGELIYNGGGSPAGTTFTTDGQSISGLVALNGTRIANGVLGPAITGNVSISVADGSDFEIPGPLGSNITVKLLNTGATQGDAITLRRFDNTSYKVFITDAGDNPVYTMNGGKEICESSFSQADNKFTNPYHKRIG